MLNDVFSSPSDPGSHVQARYTAAREQVDEYTYANTGQKGSLTTQSRRAIAAMKAIGVPRKDFKVRTVVNKHGEYTSANITLLSSLANDLVRRNADLLAACGLRVILAASPSTLALCCVPQMSAEAGVQVIGDGPR